MRNMLCVLLAIVCFLGLIATTIRNDLHREPVDVSPPVVIGNEINLDVCSGPMDQDLRWKRYMECVRADTAGGHLCWEPATDSSRNCADKLTVDVSSTGGGGRGN